MSKDFKLKLSDIPAIVSSPKAFSVYACIGVVATVVLTAIATKKLCEQEEEKSSEEETEKPILDTIVDIAKKCVAPALSMFATIFFIRKSNSGWQEFNGLVNDALVNSQNIAALYRSQAPGIVAATVMSGFNKRAPDDGKEWFCLKDLSPYGDIYFQATEIDVLSAEYKLNRNFTLRGSASVREFCAFLGEEALAQIDSKGDYYGWLMENFFESGLQPWIDFSHQHMTDPRTGRPINIITFMWDPAYTEDAELLAYGYELYPTE